MPGIPRVHSCRRFGELAALAETPCIGRPLWSVLRRDNYRELAMVATEWLVELAHESRTQPPPAGSADPIEGALADFERNFGAAIEPGMLRETREVLGSLRQLPRVAEQRDCSPWNVFLAHDGRPLVLDWESSVLDGVPGVDLIYFLTYLSFYAHGRHAFRTLSRGVSEQPECGDGDRTNPPRVSHALRGSHRCRRRPDRSAAALHVGACIPAPSTAIGGPTPAGLRPRRSCARTLFLALWEEQLGWMRRQRTAGTAPIHERVAHHPVPRPARSAPGDGGIRAAGHRGSRRAHRSRSERHAHMPPSGR